MDLSTLLLGTAMAILPLVGASLLAAMVLLERRSDAQPEPAHAFAGRPSGPRSRRGRPANARRRRA